MCWDLVWRLVHGQLGEIDLTSKFLVCTIGVAVDSSQVGVGWVLIVVVDGGAVLVVDELSLLVLSGAWLIVSGALLEKRGEVTGVDVGWASDATPDQDE